MVDKQENRVMIFDTTLRDGEQSPGASMNINEKLKVAHGLAELGVDIIEAGFPIASPGDFEAVSTVARQIEGPIIAGLARCNQEDIDRAWNAVRHAARRRIHVFLATSAIHREYKLRMAKQEIVRRARESVAYARDYCVDVEFSPEDASRTEPDFLVEVVEEAIDAGATTVNIPDTVGYAVPEQFAGLIELLQRQVSNIDRAVISVHCHNDLGLAVANSLAAAIAGARQVECTINGIGERAGNCSLEELVMAIKTRDDFFDLHTAIKTPQLYPTSRLLSNITGMQVQRNKAIVGENAFAHEAGIHQHGMLMHHSTYEIMRPEDVGFSKSNLVLGKHSGRHAFRQRIEALGYDLDDEQLRKVFADFKRLADQKREIYDADIEALIEGQIQDVPRPWSIISFQAMAGAGVQQIASVKLQHAGGRTVQEASCGDGPVDAVFRAIKRLTGVDVRLREYQVRSVTVGKDAQGEASVEAEHEGSLYRSRAVSTDIIAASAQAYLNVINRVIARTETQAAWQPTATIESTTEHAAPVG
ncbi:MAG: 2-isopropylmalate synthase [Acidobacteriota bacterium]